MTGVKRGSTLKFLSDVIRADPGYFVVIPGLNKARTAYTAYQTPVLAWALERGSFQPYPITIDGIQQGVVAVLMPSGAIECIGVDLMEAVTYTSISEWLVDAKKFCIEKVE